MTGKSAYQLSDWNGESGDRWVANQIRLDHMLEAFGDAAIAAAAPRAGERVLDIGCGAGATSIALAHSVGWRPCAGGRHLGRAYRARAGRRAA